MTRRKADVRYARYDAFKYAQLPLQRHFIRHLPSTLGVNDRDFGEGLYENSTSNDVVLGSPENGRTRQLLTLLAQTLIVLTIAVIAAIVLTSVAALVGSWASETDDFGDNLSDYLRTYTIGFLAPAGLLAVFGALAGKKLTVTRSTSAPVSDEQFASTFADLVDKTLNRGAMRKDYDRLIVFIDELDRCDPRTVVATLDSLRSFLDSDRCVFVVAADQQVLETALTEHVRQSTPHDSANPYYSAGSEYLDKTFHYQLAIPPLLPRRLSGYAAELVRDKQGVWKAVPSVDRVVSVLVPNHVRSPRRTKTLLNGYALLFELAERRCAVGHLAGSPSDRADEIAILACLRVEFPLFAGQLRTHPRLVEACRAIVLDDAAPRPPRITDQTWNVAKSFMAGAQPSDVLLVPDDADHEPTNDGDSLAVAQSHQLRAYLRKTSYVNAPDRDLIHLESSGARFGLDPADAEELEDAASQGDRATVLGILDRLDSNRQGGLLSLAESLDREVPPLGLEADNLVTILLSLYVDERQDNERYSVEAQSEIRDRFSSAVDAHSQSYELRGGDLAGALALGLDRGGASGANLVSTVLDHEESDKSEELIPLVVAAGDVLLARHPAAVARIVANGVWRDDFTEGTTQAILALPSADADRLFASVYPELATRFAAVRRRARERRRHHGCRRRRGRCAGPQGS